MSALSEMVARIRAAIVPAHKIAVTVPSAFGYNPVMIQRPVVGVGNAPQYYIDAQMLGFNSVAGGGTIPTIGPPQPCGGPMLDWQTQQIGSPTQSGTITGSFVSSPLGDRKTIGERR